MVAVSTTIPLLNVVGCKRPVISTSPAELSVILAAAVSLAPVINSNLVAFELALKSPSDTAWIAAATSTASVPVASSGAWNLIAPMTSFAAISVSPVCSVRTIGLSSPVAVCFIFSPTLWS